MALVRGSLRRCAEGAAAAMLADVGVSPAPPLDVLEIAERLRIDVRVSRMLGDGRLEHHAARDVIVVQAKTGEARRRFTIAHELGHHWLRHGGAGLRDVISTDFEEQFCDFFAAALLLPTPWLSDCGRRLPPSIDALMQIASAADVSLTSSLIGLRHAAGWRHSLLRWRQYEGRWALFATTGVPFRLREQIGMDAQTDRALQVLMHSATGRHLGPFPVGIAGTPATVEADVMLHGLGAIALVDLRRWVPPGEDRSARAGAGKKDTAPHAHLPWLDARF